MVYERIGDPRHDDGKAFLRERSPLTHIDAIVRPLLIAQGANDPRVKRAESEQIVAAMRAKKIPVTYAVFPDEGHGFARPANRLAFFALAEVFLAKHLGGRVEPLGTDGNGSSMQVATD
jgi:dipeptidyl aminopeptidase/acylaminoacyl peptidase